MCPRGERNMLARRTIPEFYRKKNVFLTGGTGFLGKALVEKLLRSFPQIDKIYLLIRPKHGKSADDRKREYLDNKVFQRVRNIHPNCHEKLKFLEGDLKSPNLGLSEESIDVIQNNVNVFIQAAALVNFNVDLDVAILHQLVPTRDLLDIASATKNVQSFVFVSTGYSHCKYSNKYTTETIQQHHVDPRELINIVQAWPKDEFKRKEKDLMGDYINTYIYCKNASENLIHEYKDKLPVAVVRPGNIMPAIYEPYPYWNESQYGLIRLLMQMKKGWTYPNTPPYNCNGVPVDMTANCLIAASNAVSQDMGEVPIYNYTLPSGLCSYGDTFKYRMYDDDVKIRFFRHLRYKYWIDLKKRLSEKIDYQFSDVLDKTTFNHFYEAVREFNETKVDFAYGNVTKLWENLNEEEKGLLFFDLRAVNWERYYRKITLD